MKRKFRLTKSTDFKKVRQYGKSYVHPLIVLITLPNEESQIRFGVATARAIGSAVQRNRAKRLVREALRPLLFSIKPGWDVVLIARKQMTEATYSDTNRAIGTLLRKANLINEL